MIIPHEGPGTWQSFLRRKDNIGLSIMEAKQKYLKEQLLFESYLNTVNTMSPSVASSAAGAGAAGGPLPSKRGGGPSFPPLKYFAAFGFGDGDIDLEKITATFVGGSYNVPIIYAGYNSSRQESWMIGYNNVAGKWMFLQNSIYQQLNSEFDYRTKTDEELQAIWLAWQQSSYISPFFNSEIPGSESAPTDPSSPIGAYENAGGKGANLISAITPFSFTRTEAQNVYGVN